MNIFIKYEPLIDKIIKETERELKKINNEAKNYNDEIIKEVKVIVKENFEQIKSDIKDMESINYEFYPKILKRLEELSVKTGEKLGTIFGLFLKETRALAKENKYKS